MAGGPCPPKLKERVLRNPRSDRGAVWAQPRSASRAQAPGGPGPRPSPALAAVLVAGGVRELLHPGARAVALLTAGQRVAAEGLGLADGAVGRHGARRADAAARQLLAQAAAAVTGCGVAPGAGGPVCPARGPGPQLGAARTGCPTRLPAWSPPVPRPSLRQSPQRGVSGPESPSRPWNLLDNPVRPGPEAAQGPTDGRWLGWSARLWNVLLTTVPTSGGAPQTRSTPPESGAAPLPARPGPRYSRLQVGKPQ